MKLAVQRGAGDIATGSAGLKLPESAPMKTALHPSERMPAAAGRVRCSASTISANGAYFLLPQLHHSKASQCVFKMIHTLQRQRHCQEY